MSILVMTTGGTIGAMPYDDIHRQPLIKTMPIDGTDVVRSMLEESFTGYDFRFITLEHRDSNLIDEAYRHTMLQLIEEAPEKKVLITHGTDTILLTADFLYRHKESLCDKTIVLTGSMVALRCGEESEGFDNLAFTLNCLSSSMSSGIFIVLCDYEDAQTQKGWKPRLYPFTPGKYDKIHDLDAMHRDRLYLLTDQAPRCVP